MRRMPSVGLIKIPICGAPRQASCQLRWGPPCLAHLLGRGCWKVATKNRPAQALDPPGNRHMTNWLAHRVHNFRGGFGKELPQKNTGNGSFLGGGGSLAKSLSMISLYMHDIWLSNAQNVYFTRWKPWKAWTFVIRGKLSLSAPVICQLHTVWIKMTGINLQKRWENDRRLDGSPSFLFPAVFLDGVTHWKT